MVIETLRTERQAQNYFEVTKYHIAKRLDLSKYTTDLITQEEYHLCIQLELIIRLYSFVVSFVSLQSGNITYSQNLNGSADQVVETGGTN